LSGGVRVRAPGASRLQSALATEGISSTLDGTDELRVGGASSARVGEIAYRCGVPLHELVPETSTLEDVFLELTTEETT
jgi:ABC-2 type transport system ATP-binding protein